MKDESSWIRLKEVLQRTLTRLRGTSWLPLARRHLPLLAVLGVPLLLFALWKVPQRMILRRAVF